MRLPMDRTWPFASDGGCKYRGQKTCGGGVAWTLPHLAQLAAAFHDAVRLTVHWANQTGHSAVPFSFLTYPTVPRGA